MKKRKLVISLLLVTVIFAPLMNYYLLQDINLTHPYEVVYQDDESNVILKTIHDKEALYIEYNQIPKEFINYLLCIEDKTFFQHKGLNIDRLVKASFHNLYSSSKQGGSTITMQLARMLYLSNSKKISRKIQEILYAIKLENNLSKEQILEYYLNLVYFAHGVYGLRTASYYYFNKDVNELCLYEMAMLIGILNSPNNYSPYIDLENSKKKSMQILMTLEKNNLISTSEYYAAFNYNLNLIEHTQDSVKGINNYYLDACVNEISKKKLLNNQDYVHGIIIDTFLNKNIQKSVENIINNINFGTYDVATVIMETNTSKVISLIGGKNYYTSSFNRALNAKKQIGSTIKPLIYYLALINGFTPLSEFESKKTIFHIKNYGDYDVSNAGEIYANRKITMLEALAMSDNIYAVKTLLSLGIKPLKELIESFSMLVDVDNITLALGANSLSLLELTSIYNCFASSGKFYKPKFIKSIKLNENEYIYKSKPNGYTPLLYKDESEIITSLLRAPFDKGLKTYAKPSLMNYYVSSHYGGKTGSTESSSWVIGFSKKYTIGVYVGSDDNTYLTKGYLSREIFQRIAKKLDEDNLDYFVPSSNLKSFKLYNTITKDHSFVYYSN